MQLKFGNGLKEDCDRVVGPEITHIGVEVLRTSRIGL